MFSFKTSASSSVLQAPAEHFTSLNSPGAKVRVRQGSSEHVLGMGDKQPAPSTPVVSDDEDAVARTRAFGVPRLPAAARHLRRTLWAVLQTCLLLATGWYIAQLSRIEKDLYFLYYQPFMPMLAMLWFWATAVRIFERRRIRYQVCFSSEDQRYLLRSSQLYQIANVLTAVVLSSGLTFAYLLATKQAQAASYHPPVLYAALLALFLFPGGVLHRDSRLFFGATLWRVFTPLRPVSWSDFLLADVLTSLAKAMSDTERAVCHLMIGPVMQPNLKACSDASFIIPLGLAAPYAWRLVQCIRVYLDTGARPQVFNAIKYSTAFPVILLSAVKYHVDQASWRGFYKPLWLGSALINSAYSFYWDVERDWEISWFSQIGLGQQRGLPRPVLRSQLLYRPAFYMYLMASNLLLRLAWTYKLSPHLRDHHMVLSCIVLAEAFRRFQWLFVRIEVELRKIQAYRPELGVLVPPAGQPLHGHYREAADSGSEEDGLEKPPLLPQSTHASQRGGLSKHHLGGGGGGGGADLELSTKI